MLLFLLVYEIILVLNFFLFLLFFIFILNKTTSCKNKMFFPSEPDMMSKELQNLDLIYVNLMTDVFIIIVKYCWKIIAKYRHLLPSGNWALDHSSWLIWELMIAVGVPLEHLFKCWVGNKHVIYCSAKAFF